MKRSVRNIGEYSGWIFLNADLYEIWLGYGWRRACDTRRLPRSRNKIRTLEVLFSNWLNAMLLKILKCRNKGIFFFNNDNYYWNLELGKFESFQNFRKCLSILREREREKKTSKNRLWIFSFFQKKFWNQSRQS